MNDRTKLTAYNMLMSHRWTTEANDIIR